MTRATARVRSAPAASALVGARCRRWAHLLPGALVLTSVFLLVACNLGPPQTGPTAAPPTPTVDPTVLARGAVASNLLSNITLVASPDPPVANQEATLTVHLARGDGGAANGVPVEVRATPPGPNATPLNLTVRAAGNGDYAAQFKPGVSGRWQVTVLAHAGGFVRQEDFPIDVRSSG